MSICKGRFEMARRLRSKLSWVVTVCLILLLCQMLISSGFFDMGAQGKESSQLSQTTSNSVIRLPKVKSAHRKYSHNSKTFNRNGIDDVFKLKKNKKKQLQGPLGQREIVKIIRHSADKNIALKEKAVLNPENGDTLRNMPNERKSPQRSRRSIANETLLKTLKNITKLQEPLQSGTSMGSPNDGAAPRTIMVHKRTTPRHSPKIKPNPHRVHKKLKTGQNGHIHPKHGQPPKAILNRLPAKKKPETVKKRKHSQKDHVKELSKGKRHLKNKFLVNLQPERPIAGGLPKNKPAGFA